MSTAQNRSDFAELWEQWHRSLELRRADPLGFLSITGLHWLDAEPRRFDGVPGAWSVSGSAVHVSLGDDEDLVVDEVRVKREHDFVDVDEQGERASYGDALVEVARRDGNSMVRPRDPSHVVRTRYVGTPTYPPSTDWVVRATLVPYDRPRSITVGASVEGLQHVCESPGEVEFQLAGRSCRLIAFNDEDPDELLFVFADLTSGTTTYAACRFLSTDGPDARGDVILDFNRARNPPCAYTDFATCPLPPPDNRLPVRVEAGEKVPLTS